MTYLHPGKQTRQVRLAAALVVTCIVALVPAQGRAVAADATAAPGAARVSIVVDARPGEVADLGADVVEQRQIPRLGFQRLTLPAAAASRAVEALERRGLEAWVDPTVTAARVPDDPEYSAQWAFQRIRAEAGWSRSIGTRDTVIAVVDTGVNAGHPDLVGALVPGYDFVNRDSDPDDDDPDGHGTSVTGVIAARTNNGTGVAGTCWRCRVMPLKVLDEFGNGFSSVVAESIVYAADNGADIINLSLSGSADDRLLEAAVNYAHGKGVVIVAAAGNDGTTLPAYPAAYDNVIGVGASTPDDTRVAFSNHGPWVSVAAPACTRTSIGTTGYGDFCGTSASAPLVAGLIGLVHSVRPDLPVEDVRRTVEEGAVPVGDWVQHGRIDMVNSVPVTPTSGNLYRAIEPSRILDTRTSIGGHLGKLGHRDTMRLQVAGTGGVPASGVTAVTLNVTVTKPSNESYLTAWPTGARRPTASNLNFVPGQTVPNLVTVKVGGDGAINLYNHSGSTHVVVDVAGYYAQGGGGSMFTALPPTRILDTRAGGSQRLGADQTRGVRVAGLGGVPRHGATAVALNVTAVDATRDSYVTAYPAGDRRPNASTVNFGRGDVIPNMAVTKLGRDGRINLYNFAGSVDVVVDVMGYFTLNERTASYVPLTPTRVVDTRAGTGGPRRALDHRSSRQVQLSGAAGLPSTGVAAVVANVTGIEPTASETYLSLYPAGAPRPVVSSLNLRRGQVFPNLATATLGTGGAVEVYNHSGSTHLVVDVAGYYTNG